MSRILITPKTNPDLDGLACAYAYTKLLSQLDKDNEYVAGIYGRPQIEARFLLERFKIEDGLVFNPEGDFNKFIIVDASDMKGMPSVIRPEDVIKVVDHRETQRAQELFVNAEIQIELIGAAATLIFEKFKEAEIEMDRKAAILLYGAIFSNTLNFQVAIASERDREAARQLEERFGFSVEMITEMFQYKTEYMRDNLREVIEDDFKVFDMDNGQKLEIAQIEGFDLEDVLNSKKTEIIFILEKLKKENALDIIFLTMADIKNGYNLIVAIDDASRSFLSARMKWEFTDGVAKTSKLLLRKQMLPALIN